MNSLQRLSVPLFACFITRGATKTRLCTCKNLQSEQSLSMSKDALRNIALLAFGCVLITRGLSETSSDNQSPTIEDLVQAQSALLVDAQTGRVLFSRAPDQLHQPASTIKLLTALLVAEETGMQGTVKVNYRKISISTPGASMAYLRDGSIHSVRDLTRVMLVRSFNDVASILAVHVAGSEAEFVRKMQQRARELGANSTVVRNPHGLPDPQQLTTARDLLKIFRAVLAHPTLRAFCTEPFATIDTINGRITVSNTNKLLGTFPGMGPAKTGYTRSSRHTYAASATRNGRELLLVLLNSPNKWTDARALFEYGFALLEGKKPTLAQSTSAPPPAKTVKTTQVIKKAIPVQNSPSMRTTSIDEILNTQQGVSMQTPPGKTPVQ